MEPYVITISRGCGCHGKQIALQLSEKLSIPCYDREIIQMAADKSGLSEALFDKSETAASKFSLFKRNYSTSDYVSIPVTAEDKSFTSNENLFQIEAEIIRKLADSKSCIILGRAANYLLRYYKNVISLHIHAPLDFCIEEVLKRESTRSTEDAKKYIQRTEKYRADFYQHYTGQKWTDPSYYDFIMNSQRIGVTQCADYIIDYAKFKLKDTILCNQ